MSAPIKSCLFGHAAAIYKRIHFTLAASRSFGGLLLTLTLLDLLLFFLALYFYQSDHRSLENSLIWKVVKLREAPLTHEISLKFDRRQVFFGVIGALGVSFT